MDLLNRYLRAVGARLPDAQREGIVAELREELLSRIEEHEQQVHRHLTEGEVVALLKAYGHPLVVAASYLRDQHLISPVLLPFYRFAAQVLIGVDLLAHGIYVVVALFFREPPGHVLGTAANSLWIVTMYLLGAVTFGALVLDRIGAGRWLLKAWSPKYLPRSARRRPARTLLVLDSIAVIVLAGWLSGALPVWTWIASPVAAHVHPIVLWRVAGAVLLLVAVLQLATHVVERLVPRLALPCLIAKLIQNIMVLVLAGALVSARPWLRVSGLDTKLAQAFGGALNAAMEMSVGVLVAAAAIALGMNAVRLARRARKSSVSAPTAA